MIDIENEVYTRVRAAIKEQYPDAYVSAEYERIPKNFPAIMIVESNNVPFRQYQDSGSMENYAILNYDINIYSNDMSGRKTGAKAIAKIVDDEMAAMGFMRTMGDPMPNEADASIYRYVLRYQAIAGADNLIYSRR